MKLTDTEVEMDFFRPHHLDLRGLDIPVVRFTIHRKDIQVDVDSPAWVDLSLWWGLK